MTVIQRSGEVTVESSPDEVMAVLRDPERIVRCLPDRVEAVTHDGGWIYAEVRVGIPAIRTKVHLRVQKQADNANSVAYRGHGTAARSRIDLDGEFTVAAVADGARITWDGEARITGVLAALGESPGAYEGIVTEKIDMAIANVTEEAAE